MGTTIVPQKEAVNGFADPFQAEMGVAMKETLIRKALKIFCVMEDWF